LEQVDQLDRLFILLLVLILLLLVTHELAEVLAVFHLRQILENLIGHKQVMAVQVVVVLTTNGDGRQVTLLTLALETVHLYLLLKLLFRDITEQWALVLMALMVVAEAVVAVVALVALVVLVVLDRMVGTTRLMSITLSEQAELVV
jgi:hypothetical protein